MLSACGGGASNAVLSKADEKRIDSVQQDCVSRQVIDLLRDKIFDTAITTSNADKKATQNLNNLRAALLGRVENPVLQGHEAQIRKTNCAGHLVFGLPPSVIKAFGGDSSLSADIAYSIQPAADNSGLVVAATGIDAMVQTLVDASQHKRIVRVEIPGPKMQAAPRIEPNLSTMFDPPAPPSREIDTVADAAPAANPSFGCKRALSRVEKLICADSMLADQDRALDSAYRDARNRASDADMGGLNALHQKYRQRRDSCRDSACVSATYDAWISDIYAWQPG
jgi:uncharacterized protein YecT (DUF1311 family)